MYRQQRRLVDRRELARGSSYHLVDGMVHRKGGTGMTMGVGEEREFS